MANGETIPHCPFHQDVKQQLAEMTKIQAQRPCAENRTRINGLKEAEARLERENAEQWDSINDLKRHIYMGMGGLAVISFVLQILAAYLIKAVCK